MKAIEYESKKWFERSLHMDDFNEYARTMPVLFESEKIGFSLYKKGEKVYRICALTDQWAGAEEIEVFEFTNSSDDDYITCPFCGHEYLDSWDIDQDDGDYECGVCDAVMTYERVTTVKYSTKLIKEPEINAVN